MKRLLSLSLALIMLLALLPGAALAEEDPVVIRVFGRTENDQGPWKDTYLIQFIEEKFNVSFDITEINTSVWQEKTSIAFATDDYPDLFLNGLTDAEMQTYGSQGIFIDLNEYINEENTPNIYQIYQDYPALRKASQSVDGRQFYFHGYDRTNLREYARGRFFVNKQWMTDLGLEVPTTLDEFYEYLKAVKASDESRIPMTGAYEQDSHSLMILPLAALGYSVPFMNNNSGEYVDIKDGSVIFVPTEDLFIEALSWMKKLYTEELLDNEYFTQTTDQKNAKLAEGRVGCFMDWAQWLRITDEDMYSQYDGIVPLTSESNDTPIWPSYDIQHIGMFAITDKCEDVLKLLSICDWATTFEAYSVLLGGPELGTWEGKEDQGVVIEYLDEAEYNVEKPVYMHYSYPEDEYTSAYDWRRKVISPGWGALPLCRLDFTEIDSTPNEAALTNALINNYADAFKVGWPNSVKFTEDEYNTLSLIRADLDSYVSQMVAKFITGEENLDNFAAFQQGCKDRGLDQYMEIYQRAYDRYIES